MSLDQTIFIAATLLLAATVQSAVGIGFPIIAVPMLLLAGFQPHEAIMTSAAANMLGMLVALHHHRRDVHPRPLLPWVALCLASLPVGAAVLWLVSKENEGLVQQIVGVIVLIMVAARQLLKVKPHRRVAPGWGVLAAVTSGVSTGLSGIGGPPLVLWVMAHDWPPARARASLWVFFIPYAPAQMLAYTLAFGTGALWAALRGALFLPVVLVGTAAGLWIGKRIEARTLRVIITIMLVLIGLSAILRPMFK